VIAVIAMVMLFFVIGLFAAEEQAPNEADEHKWEQKNPE